MNPSSAAAAISVIAALAAAPRSAPAAPVVESARAAVAFQSPTSCTVDLALDVDGSGDVEHRLEIADGGRVELIEIAGATVAGGPRDLGRTRVLVLRPDRGRYTLRYAVQQPPDRADRCPLWIPTIPTSGEGRSVQLAVRIPPGAIASGTMPAFTWSNTEGATALGHLPAFVHVPYALPGEPARWDLARMMDAVSIVALIVATLVWAARHRSPAHG